jgi:hypothetical protein
MFSSMEDRAMDEMLAYAAAGEERDAAWRTLAQDLADAAAARRDGPGFVRASRPADLAKALGPRRREARRKFGG